MFKSGSMAQRIWVSSAMWVVFLAAGHGLTISEIMYHPMALPGDEAVGGEALEYLELYNPGPETEDLTGYAIGGGVSFAFPEGTLLGPEQWVFYPRPEYCTDNGAMIAYAGLQRLKAGQTVGLAIEVQPRWSLEALPPV